MEALQLLVVMVLVAVLMERVLLAQLTQVVEAGVVALLELLLVKLVEALLDIVKKLLPHHLLLTHTLLALVEMVGRQEQTDLLAVLAVLA
jgi:hypothetical protein